MRSQPRSPGAIDFLEDVIPQLETTTIKQYARCQKQDFRHERDIRKTIGTTYSRALSPQNLNITTLLIKFEQQRSTNQNLA